MKEKVETWVHTFYFTRIQFVKVMFMLKPVKI